MKMISGEKENEVLRIFRKKKVLTVIQISDLLDAAVPTVRKRLKTWSTFTSYNMNGRFYTLADIPIFNEYGIWMYKDILFSKHGNLKETVIQLINRSEMGLQAREISEIVGIPHQSFLSHFRNSINIRREKIKDKFIYFAGEQKLYLTQKLMKDKSLDQASIQLPTDTDAIRILVDRIRYPDATIKACCQRLRRKSKTVSCELIQNLLDYHGIKKKQKR